MVSVTLAVPSEIKQKMDRFSEINWSGFIRNCIIEKTKELSWKEELLKRVSGERQMMDWAVKTARVARKGRTHQLQTKGLI